MYSTTQATNVASIVGVVVLILNHFKVDIGTEELSTLIGSGLAIFGVISNWIHRYKKGGLTLGGFRK